MMKHTGFIAVILAGAVSLTAFAAAAHGPGGMRSEQMSFEQLDADANGEITRAEMTAHREARFAGADTDGNGSLSRDELIAAGDKRSAERVDRMLSRFDANKDGALTQDEMPKPRDAGDRFDRIDRDGSGGVSKAEFEEAKAHMKGRKKRHSSEH